MEYDLRSHSNKRLGSILANPRHPAHSAAKAERDRRLAMKNEAATPMRNLKLINKIKDSGVVSQGSMSKKKDSEVVSQGSMSKKEAYDEPQGQAKRMMSPLQKMRMDKEKADRDREGKLKPGVVKRGKSTMNRLKDIRQRADAFAVKSRKEEVDLDEMKDEWKTDTGWKKPETIKKDRFGNVIKNVPKHLAKAAAKKSAEMNKEEVELEEGNMMSAAKELEVYARKNGGIDKNDFMKAVMMMKRNQKRQLDKFVDELDTEPREKILSVMQKHMKEEVELDEVLDRPGALDSYRKKADDSGNRARNSATRKILTAPKNGERPDHSAELKTMKKRNKGQDMADRVAARQFRKSIGQPYIKKEEVEHVDEGILKPYHAAAKQPWSKTVKDSKGTAGEYKQIGKGKDFTVHTAYRGSNKSQPHYVVRDDKIIGSGMTFSSALKDAKVKEKDVTHRSKFADGSILNKGMKEQVELEEKVNTKAIQKAVDDGKSMDVIVGMFANKRTTNTDEIRKVVKDYMWKKRMKKEEVEHVNEKKLTPKEVKRALASIKPPKEKPTLPKAPWEKEKTEEGFVSHAQRKAVWATKKDGGKGHPDNKKKNEAYVPERLTVGDGMGSWIKDFQASDAPQFAGKSQKKKRDMAIAAYLDAKRSKKESVEEASLDEKKGLTIPKFRSALYKGAKALGDVQAVKKKKVGKRIGRRVVGKMAGRLLGKMFR